MQRLGGPAAETLRNGCGFVVEYMRKLCDVKFCGVAEGCGSFVEDCGHFAERWWTICKNPCRQAAETWWEICGNFVERLRKLCGDLAENVRKLCRNSAESLWRICGKFAVNLRKLRRKSAESLQQVETFGSGNYSLVCETVWTQQARPRIFHI